MEKLSTLIAYVLLTLFCDWLLMLGINFLGAPYGFHTGYWQVVVFFLMLNFLRGGLKISAKEKA
jgi:hypothetical protein